MLAESCSQKHARMSNWEGWCHASVKMPSGSVLVECFMFPSLQQSSRCSVLVRRCHAALQCGLSAFLVADADGFIDSSQENFAVANFARARCP